MSGHQQIWLLDPVTGWIPARTLSTRLAQTPKNHFADPALAARLLGATKTSLLSGQPAGPAIARDGTLLGALFESLIALNFRVYAQANKATVHHLHTRNGDHEVDVIIERDDHKIVALEVKLSATVGDSASLLPRMLSRGTRMFLVPRRLYLQLA